MAYQRTEVVQPKGINKDISPYELPPEIWSDGSNINFRRGRTNKQLGYRNAFEIPSTAISPLWLTYFSGDVEYWVYGSETTIMKTTGAVNTTIGTGFNATRDFNWSSCNFNSVLVMNNPIDHPQYLPEGDGTFNAVVPLEFWGTEAADTILPPSGTYQWGAASRAFVIRPYKNYLFAMNCTDAQGIEYPNMVRWSSPAQLGDIPPSWDPTSPSEQAGLYSLSDTPGRLLDAATLGDYMVLYKTDAVWLAQFIGGDFNFSFRKIFSDEAGMLAAECWAEFDGKHFVMSTSGAYIHNGATKQEVMEPWVKDEFFNNVADEQLKNTRVAADHNNHEIWVYYTTKESGSNGNNDWCDRALVYHWRDSTWTIRELTGISYIAEGFSRGIIEPQDQVWDDDEQPWEDDETIWNSDTSSNPDTLNIMFSDYFNMLLYLSESDNGQAGQTMTGWVQRIGIDMNDDHDYKYLTRVVPHIIGSVPVDITIYSSTTQVVNPTIQLQTVFDPTQEWNVDCHVTGRYLGIRFSCNGFFQLNGYSLEWETTGTQ